MDPYLLYLGGLGALIGAVGVLFVLHERRQAARRS
jgi:hypothetical protein